MRFRRLLAIVISLFVTGCQAPPATASLPAIANGVRAGGATESRHMHLSKHMLVFITDSGELRYWPIDAKGGHISYPLGTVTGATSPTAMAANGDTVAIAFSNPSSVVLYDTATGTQRSLRVGRGAPTDIAYDNQGNIVVFDSYAEILVYRAPQFARKLVNCELVTASDSYIAADREGDIFVNQQSRGANEIVEIPKGSKGYESKKCSKLPIEEDGYNAGLAVDPKTMISSYFTIPTCARGETRPKWMSIGSRMGRARRRCEISTATAHICCDSARISSTCILSIMVRRCLHETGARTIPTRISRNELPGRPRRLRIPRPLGRRRGRHDPE
jgi:hypothetical protein